MALGGSCLCCSSCQNLSPLDLVENELARDSDAIGGPHLGSSSPTLSRNPIPGPNLVSALVSALVPASVPALISALAATNNLFKQFTKTYLDLNQRPDSLQQSANNLLKQRYQSCIMVSYICTTITSVSSQRPF